MFPYVKDRLSGSSMADFYLPIKLWEEDLSFIQSAFTNAILLCKKYVKNMNHCTSHCYFPVY